MRTLAFSSRCAKEMLRDKLNLAFGLGFPLVVLLLLSAINSKIPEGANPMFELKSLAPGMAFFGLSFVALFSGMLIARDRGTWFLTRLFASPMRAPEFILGYALPLVPMAAAQSLICFAAACVLGLGFTPRILLAVLALLPSAVMFIAIGLFAGSALTERQVGGICGALLTNLSAWLSGAWFDPVIVGGIFETIANALPFVHGVRAARYALAGGGSVWGELIWVAAYAVALLVLAAVVFRGNMNSDKL